MNRFLGPGHLFLCSLGNPGPGGVGYIHGNRVGLSHFQSISWHAGHCWSGRWWPSLPACVNRLTSEMELETGIRRLSSRIQRLESVQRHSKTLRHKATDLESQLESFSAQYLQIQR